jgi:ElaB/YqjD/DUF883 family membrane-anchored ribosome-binding protein
MNSKNLNRRQLIVAATGVGLVSLIPTSAAQEPQLINPNDAGKIHGETLKAISSLLGSELKIDTEKGMLAILELLVEKGAVSKEEAPILENLIHALFDPSKDPDKLRKNIEQLWSKERERLSNVAAAIFSIARQSVNSAEKYATEHPRQIAIVSADVLGAMTGAVACAEGGPIVAVLCVVAGSVAESAKAAFETKH